MRWKAKRPADKGLPAASRASQGEILSVATTMATAMRSAATVEAAASM